MTSKTLQQQNKYEVEIEHVAKDTVLSEANIQELYVLIYFVLKHVQDAYIPISVTQEQVMVKN